MRLRERGTGTAKLLLEVDAVNEDLLTSIEDNNPVGLPGESIGIHDDHGRAIFHLGAPAANELDTALTRRVLSAGLVRDKQGLYESVAFLFPNKGERYIVVVSAVDLYGRSKLRTEIRLMSFTFLLAQVLIFFVGRFYAQRALSPVQRLVSEIKTTSAANLSRRVHAGNGQDEMAQLARSFNDLLDRLDTTFRSQRDFIANASHELRTPLTMISGQLEVLLLKERSSAEYAGTLRSVLEDMHSLNRLSDRLLQMAQAENTAPVSSFSSVRMDEVLWQARSEVIRMDPSNQVEIDLGEVEDEEDLVVHGNETLLRSLVSNLMENACKYSPDRTARVTLKADANELHITVADKGIGITGEHQARVFEPFFRVDNTATTRGHGVGLSLVARIAQLHKGHVTLVSGPGKGSAFTAHLPKVA
jgi:signal transduction histidine kinase